MFSFNLILFSCVQLIETPFHDHLVSNVGRRKYVVLNVNKKLKLQKQLNQLYVIILGTRETNYIFQKLTIKKTQIFLKRLI